MLCFFPLVFFHSTVTGACPVTPDLIIRAKVRAPTKKRKVEGKRYGIPRIRIHSIRYGGITLPLQKEATCPALCRT